MRPLRCRVCGSLKISAVYRQRSLILITCGACSAIWTVEPEASETRMSEAQPRQNPEQDDKGPSVH